MQPRWLIASTRVISRVNRVFLAISGIFAALIMFVILQDVVRRYVLNDPSSWVLDICSFMLVYAYGPDGTWRQLSSVPFWCPDLGICRGNR